MRLDHLLSGKIALESERPLLSAVVEHTACERDPAKMPISASIEPATSGHFAETSEGSVAQLVRAPS